MRTPLALLALFASITVNAAITGRVVTEEGNPIAGARIRAYERETEEAFKARVLSPSPERAVVATATTREDGSFSLDPTRAAVDLLIDAPGRQLDTAEATDGADAGTFILGESKPRRGRVTFGGKGIPNALVVTARAIVTRTDGEGYYDAFDFATPAPPPMIIHPDFAISDFSVFSRDRNARGSDATLRRGVTLRGRVLAEDRKTGVPNTVVRIEGWPMATTAEEGTFTIAHAPEKWRMLVATDDKRAGMVSRSSSQSYTIVLASAATLTGTVRNAKDDAPIPAARVRVSPEPDFSSARTAIADAKGNFVISALPPGSYRGVATAPGFMVAPVSVDLGPGARGQRNFSVAPLPRITGIVIDEERKPVAGVMIHYGFSSRSAAGPDGRFSITTTPYGQPLHFVARKRGYAPAIFGPFVSESGQSRSGVTVVLTRGFTFRLRVEDRNKQPVANEPVTIARPGEDERNVQPIFICGGRGGTTALCHTDSRGVLEMQLAEGKYEIVVGGGAAALKRIPAQTLSARESAMTVTVDRGVEVSGRVTYTDGSPVDPTNVLILNKEGPLRQFARGDSVNSDGTFVLRNVAPGPVTLYAEIMSAAPIEGPSVEITAPAKDVVLTIPKPIRIEGRVVDKDNKQPVRVFSINVRRYRGGGGYGAENRSFSSEEGTFVMDDISLGPLELTVSAAGYAPAMVSNAALSEKGPITIQLERGALVTGRVTSDGAPVADANVSLSGGPRSPATMRNTVITDAEGEFRFDSAGTGEYSLFIFKKGFAQGRKVVEIASGKETRIEIELQRGRELRGRVVDSEGRPVSLARVFARGGSGVPSTQSDAEGNFELTGIPDGTYTISAEKSGYMPATMENVEVSKTSPITLTLQHGGTITGRVTGLSDRELAVTRVSIVGGGSWSTTRVDASGSFTLSGVPDGMIRVQAEVQAPRTRQSSTKMIEVIRGSAPPVELDFSGTFAVTGRVTRGGVPLPSATVTFDPVGSPGGSSGRDLTAADGRYDVMLSSAGEYSVGVEFGPAGRFDAGGVNIGGAMMYDIEVRGGSLAGRVVDAETGAAVPSALVQLLRMGGRGAPNITTDSEGRFSFELLTAGRYTMRASKTRYAMDMQEIEVREGVPADVEIRLRQGERVGVRVVDGVSGRPLDNVSITVMDAATKKFVQGGAPTRDDAGLWRVWVVPGRYVARVLSPRYLMQMVDLTVPGPDVVVQLQPAGRIVLQSISEGSIRARLLDARTRKIIMQVGVPPAVFESVAPGSYQVELIDRNSVVLATKDVRVTGPQTVTVPMN